MAFEQEEPEMAMDKIEEVHTTLKPSTEKSVKAPVLTVKRTMAAREDIEMAGYSEDVPKKGKADRKMAKKNYIVAEIMPMFRGGGVDEFSTYLGDSLKVILPDSVLRESIVVSFRVRSNGKIDKVKLIGKTSSKELNDEVVRLVEESPMWMPGMLNGTPIDVDQQLELVFNK